MRMNRGEKDEDGEKKDEDGADERSFTARIGCHAVQVSSLVF